LDEEAKAMADSEDVFADEENILLARAITEITNRGNERITIETDLNQLIAVIAMIQLGLRFPGVQDNGSAQIAERFVSQLIEKIDPDHGPVWTLLNRGFNPTHDQP
jgi:hypothetical protein